MPPCCPDRTARNPANPRTGPIDRQKLPRPLVPLSSSPGAAPRGFLAPELIAFLGGEVRCVIRPIIYFSLGPILRDGSAAHVARPSRPGADDRYTMRPAQAAIRQAFADALAQGFVEQVTPARDEAKAW